MVKIVFFARRGSSLLNFQETEQERLGESNRKVRNPETIAYTELSVDITVLTIRNRIWDIVYASC